MTNEPADVPAAEPLRRRRWPVLLVVVAVLAAAGTLGGRQLLQAREGRAADQPVAALTALPAYAPDEGEDGSDERLSDVVADGRRLLAVGDVTSGGRTTPVFLASEDLGVTWQRTEVRDGSGATDRVEHVTAGVKGRAALGTGEEGVLTWTSSDGTTWQRHAPGREVFREDDEVYELRAVPSGFLAVGTEEVPGGEALGVLWESPDGVTWTRRTLADLGLRPERKGSYFSDVAVQGSTVVVAAGEYDQSADLKNNIAFYTSTDGGRSFRRAPTPLDLANEGRAYVRVVLPTGTGFTALGLGSSPDDGYDTAVLTSPDGLTWTFDESVQPRARGNDLVAAGAIAPYGVVGVGASDSDGLLVGQNGGSFFFQQGSRSAALSRPGDQALTGVAVVDDVLVAVGRDTSTGDGDALVVRRQGTDSVATAGAAGLERVAVPQVDDLAAPSAEVFAVTASDDGFVVTGSSGTEGALWSSADGARWEALRPRRGVADGDGEQALYGVTAPATGGLVAVGTTEGSLAPDALLVRTEDGSLFENALPSGFVRENEYADRVLVAAASGPRAVVAVGYGDDGGADGSAHVVVAPEGGRFQVGRAATPQRDGVDDLVGLIGRSRSMNDVAARGDGFVAVGGAGVDDVYRPAAWTSVDGSTWALSVLPLPQGAVSASLEDVVVAGDRVIAVGSATGPDGVAAPRAWTSEDGRTWSTPAPLPVERSRHGRARDVLVVGDTLLAVGDVRDPDSGDRDAAAWTSADGATWEPYALSGAAAPADGSQTLAAGAVSGDRVLLVGSSSAAQGTEVLLVRLRAEDFASR